MCRFLLKKFPLHRVVPQRASHHRTQEKVKLIFLCLLSFLEKKLEDLWDHYAVCMFVPPLSVFEPVDRLLQNTV